MTARTAISDLSPHRRYRLGARRWNVAWWTRPVGAPPLRDDWDPTVDLDAHGRAFPNRALAVAFARKLEDFFGAPMVREEEFCEMDRHSGIVVGSWDPVSEWEEVTRE